MQYSKMNRSTELQAIELVKLSQIDRAELLKVQLIQTASRTEISTVLLQKLTSAQKCFFASSTNEIVRNGALSCLGMRFKSYRPQCTLYNGHKRNYAYYGVQHSIILATSLTLLHLPVLMWEAKKDLLSFPCSSCIVPIILVSWYLGIIVASHPITCAGVFAYSLYDRGIKYLVPTCTIVSKLCCSYVKVWPRIRDYIDFYEYDVSHFSEVFSLSLSLSFYLAICDASDVYDVFLLLEIVTVRSFL